MRRFVPIAFTLSASLAALVACSGDESPSPGSGVVAVRISPDNPVVLEGSALAFKAVTISETGEEKDVSDSPSTTWASSETNVVSINADGTGEAEAEGTSYVTARVRGVTSPAQLVTVNPIPTTPPPTPTPTPAPTANHVVISEVMYDSDTEPGGEYVELFNPTGAPIDISGYELSTKGGTGTSPYVFAATTTINAGAYLVVANNPTTYNTDYGQTTTFDGGFSMLNSGDWIVLKNMAGGTVIDEMAYEAGNTGKPAAWCAIDAPTSTDPAGAGNAVSVSRNPDGSDGDNCNDWVNNSTPSPGAANP